jgi:hypothetical protein
MYLLYQLVGAYTTTLYMMVDKVQLPSSPGWADFPIMMECTLVHVRCLPLCVICGAWKLQV